MNRKKKWALLLLGVLILLAVVVCLIFKSGESTENMTSIDGSETELVMEDSKTALGIEEGFITIYYVEDGQIKSEEEYLLFNGEDVFEAWKRKNGLGAEVKLISSYTESNGEESTYEFQGQTIASYKVGDYFVYNIVISTEIENYFDTIDKELLLSSWEQTIRGYSLIDYDEFHIIIE